MSFFKHFWLKRALHLVTEKLAPIRIPLSGERAFQNDFYHADLRILDGIHCDIMVQSTSPDGFTGYSWDEDERQYIVEVSVCFSLLNNYEIHISKYYKGHEFTFRSPKSFVLNEAFKLPNLKIKLDELAQWLVNSRTPTRKNRIGILRTLIGDREERAAEQQTLIRHEDLNISLFQLMTLLYGPRIRQHPQYFSLLDHLHLNVEAMAENGEVRYQEQRIHVTGQALNSIARYEEDNRRNRSEVFRNWIMLGLTLIIAVASWVAIYKTK